ncbi:MAG TPA: MMPL family transporter [Solirubrobacteraceae bacterium]|jgi:RND superfamily putative drug exporter|nr:MMPL family transporter [Solirubrobacteraceae bacterium]
MIDRCARLATERTRRILLIAGAAFLLAAAIGVPVVTILKSESSDFQDPNAPNQQVLRAIEHATGQAAYYGVAALVSSGTDARTDPVARAQATHVVALLSRQPGFQRALDYPATHLPVLVSRNGHQTLVLAAFADRERSAAAVERVRPLLAGANVRLGGNDVAFAEINKRTSSDLARAETFALPILLLLSFWVFRGLIAAALPLLVGGFAIVITFLLLRLIDQFAGLSVFAVNLVTGVGLGLGIDYSLFILSRYREELARGLDTHAAIRRTLQTAGRTVMFGSLTVAGALSCLLVFPLRFLYSMGVGGALVTLSAGAVSLIVLPAVLVALGPRIDALAPARLQRNAAKAAQPAEHGAWYRLARAVMRRPGAVALGTAAVLIVIALPALRLQLTPADAHVLPSSAQPRQVAEAITHDFAVDGSQTVTLVARAPQTGASTLAALAHRAQIAAGAQASLAGPPRYLGRGAWEIEMLPRGTDGSAANQQLIHRLRALAGRSSIGPPTLLVGGATAWFVDQKAAIAANTPLALLILALVTGGFLFLMTGSLVLPLLALLMNLLTVAVGAGLLVLIFQDGHLASLAGFTPIGGLEESNLVLLFVVAFALSTDYGVFLFGRIKEAHDGGMATRDAVAYGVERTGRLITAAALLFCVAVGAFVTSHIFFIKQFGVGTALAVAIDATFVRALLVPALMGRLGESTWWAPRPLRRLHARVGLGEGLGDPTGA